MRFNVWKIREICNMTGPVSGSFIHCVLFKGFSSMSSKAVGEKREDGGSAANGYKCELITIHMQPVKLLLL